MGSQPNHFGGARPTKQLGKTVAKLALGTILLYYVLHSQMIDFKSLGPALLSPRTLCLSLSFLLFSATICAFRWYLLATAQGLTVSYRTMFELTMIGNFFNTFLPGSVGGDFIKAWYIASHSAHNKTRAVFTVILDRIIGLAVIVFYSAFSLCLFTEILKTDHRLQMIGYSVWAFTTVAFLGALIFYSPYVWKQPWFNDLFSKLEGFGPLGKVVQAAVLYRKRLGTIIKATLLSSVSVLGITTLYVLHGQTLGISLPIARYFFVIPVGLVASAIPLLPGGIGVGQVAFFTLFRLVGETPEHGATLCTLLQLHTIFFNCAGFIFYFKYKQPNGNKAYTVPV